MPGNNQYCNTQKNSKNLKRMFILFFHFDITLRLLKDIMLGIHITSKLTPSKLSPQLNKITG